MKKLLSFVLVAALTLSFTACGKKTDSQSAEKVETKKTVKVTKTAVIDEKVFEEAAKVVAAEFEKAEAEAKAAEEAAAAEAAKAEAAAQADKSSTSNVAKKSSSSKKQSDENAESGDYPEFTETLYTAWFDGTNFCFYHDQTENGYFDGLTSAGNLLQSLTPELQEKYHCYGYVMGSNEKYEVVGKYKNTSKYADSTKPYMTVIKITIPLKTCNSQEEMDAETQAFLNGLNN